jgi:precorrin-4/cobalt-precorrin-4 C11-methyltransferase
MPEREKLREFARHGTTMAIFLSAARTSQMVDELRAGGYPDATPVVIAYRTSWPDEVTLSCRLDEVEALCKERKLWRQTLFLVGAALDAKGTRSHLYHAGHFHTFRKPDAAARRQLRASRAAGRPAP